ncbi:MAG: DUF819 family protein [Acidobacteriota bacterium]|jgi:uncharacterized membrane protein
MDGPLITNDAVNLGILMTILAFVFVTSHSERPGWKRFYSIVPSLLVCYFLPSVFTTLGVYDPDQSQLYFVASRYLLPASLVLLTLSIDLPAIMRLGPKAGVMFLAGTLGIVMGGPLAIILVSMVSPDTVGGVGPDAVWRGMTTVAGSWIGGGANQTAMKEVFDVGDDVFSAMIAVDVIVANIWMAILLFGIGRSEKIDRFLRADTSAIEEVRRRVEAYQAEVTRVPTLTDTMKVLGVGFGVMGLSHFLADLIAPWLSANAPWLERYNLTSSFFWLVVIATTAGLVLSYTRARELEGVGASRIGSALLYVLIAAVGMRMNLMAVSENPGLFAVGAIWISFHALVLIVVAKLIRAPYFFLAVGSQANVGGAASAPIVASAFHPALATVGVLLAVLGYALGTYGAWICGQLMRVVAVS